MRNPELADRLLEFINTGGYTYSSKGAADRLQVDKAEVEMALDDIMEIQPDWLLSGNTSLLITPTKKHEIEKFLKSGGFVTWVNSEKDRLEKAKAREELELDSLRAFREQAEAAKEQVEQLKKQVELKANQVLDAESSAKSASTWSWIGAIIAGISAAAAVIALFKDK